MNVILDELELKNKSRLFSYLSFGLLILTIILFIVLFQYSPELGQTYQSGSTPPKLLVYALKFSTRTGAICAVLSIIRKEPSSLLKWFSAIFNSIIIILILILKIFGPALLSQI
jgi:hypothetical protein